MSNDTELIKLLDLADALPAAVRLRARSYDLLRLRPGDHAVDVGCGAGRAVAELNDRKVTAIGVDVSEEMIDVARRRRPDADFRVGDACRLPLRDHEVAGYRADKVFHELGDPARALAEAARVLAPGGRIVLVGQDWDAFVIDSHQPGLTRTIVRARADLTAAPRAARGYRNLLLDAGFGEVDVEVHVGLCTDRTMLRMLTGLAEAVHAAGVITREQHDAWVAEQVRRAEQDRLFLALPLFVASATRAS
ncbi:methyltransferase domain-containing protein [Actinomadura sp. ATCC 31491]|uniref:Methyltransferase domain-containing protein n=1 Tax=Actinomadura luzonensis TaxID=2805427 RepID=A0ABT0FXM7_9ACTN|nr:methyltransferase domain-containing protein [Actinomadura luzonensis]MCK2217104.1 methyltransferase domain-containing protein [Actinomadura luzonensis]